MSAIRLPLLCAFAGGCLSSAVLFGLWRADTGAAVAVPARQPQVTHQPALAASSAATPSPELLAEAPHHPAPEPEIKAEASPAKDAADPSSAEATPAGSAVSDILTDLEAAYRQRLIAAARAEAAEAAEASAQSAPATSTARLASAIARAEPREAAAPVAPVAPPVAPAAPVAAAPVAVAPVAVAVPVAAAPALVAQNSAPARDVHYGDVNNTYITNVRQGDVYVMQQQIAMMQYMQLLGASSAAARVAPVHGTRAALAQAPQTQQYRQFPSTLTNPDNPWGFNFAPLNLVH